MLIFERCTDSQTWLVVFDRSHGRIYWWERFLHPAFRHVYLLREINGKCVMVNALSHIMTVKEFDSGLFETMRQIGQQNPTAILQMTVHYGAFYKGAPLDLITCVSVAKRILGIHKRVRTPKGLYRELLRAGAIAIKPWAPY